MYERFSERSIFALMLAQEEGRRLNHSFVAPEHFVLGLIGENKGEAATALKQQEGVTLASARTAVQNRLRLGPETPRLPWFFRLFQPDAPMSFTTGSKRMLQQAAQEASKQERTIVVTGHMLLALIHLERESPEDPDDDSAGARELLLEMGVDIVRLEKTVFELLESNLTK